METVSLAGSAPHCSLCVSNILPTKRMKPNRPPGFISLKHQFAMELGVLYLIALASFPFVRTRNSYPFMILQTMSRNPIVLYLPLALPWPTIRAPNFSVVKGHKVIGQLLVLKSMKRAVELLLKAQCVKFNLF